MSRETPFRKLLGSLVLGAAGTITVLRLGPEAPAPMMAAPLQVEAGGIRPPTLPMPPGLVQPLDPAVPAPITPAKEPFEPAGPPSLPTPASNAPTAPEMSPPPNEPSKALGTLDPLLIRMIAGIAVATADGFSAGKPPTPPTPRAGTITFSKPSGQEKVTSAELPAPSSFQPEGGIVMAPTPPMQAAPLAPPPPNSPIRLVGGEGPGSTPPAIAAPGGIAAPADTPPLAVPTDMKPPTMMAPATKPLEPINPIGSSSPAPAMQPPKPLAPALLPDSPTFAPLNEPGKSSSTNDVRPIESPPIQPIRMAEEPPPPKKPEAKQPKVEPPSQPLIPLDEAKRNEPSVPPIESSKPLPMPQVTEESSKPVKGPEPRRPQPEEKPAHPPMGVRFGEVEPAPQIAAPPHRTAEMIPSTLQTTPSTKPTVPEPANASAESYDVDLHIWREGDTFPGLCGRYYNDQGYAQALLTYNNDYRLDRVRGGGVSPREGQYIGVPPIWVLRKKYPGLVPSLDGGASRTPARVTGAAGGSINRSTSLGARNSYLPNATSIYFVGAGGETLKEIARRKYGREDFWQRIYDLNRSVNPEESIPEGTKLILPEY